MPRPMRLALPLALLAGCTVAPAVSGGPPSKPGLTTGTTTKASPAGFCSAEICDGNSTGMAQTSLYDPGMHEDVPPFPTRTQQERAPQDAAGEPEPLPPDTTLRGTLIADDVDRVALALPPGVEGDVWYRFIAGMRSGLRFEVNPELGSSTVHPGLTGSEGHERSIYFAPDRAPHAIRIQLTGRLNAPIGDTLPVPYRFYYRMVLRPTAAASATPTPEPTATPDPNATPTPDPNATPNPNASQP